MSLAEGVAKKSQCRGVVARTERPERSQKHKKRKAMCISFSVACPPADRTFLFWGESCAKKVSPSATTNKNTASEGSNKKNLETHKQTKTPRSNDRQRCDLGRPNENHNKTRQCRFARTHTKKKTNDLTHKNQDKQANNSKTPLFSLKQQNEQVASNGDTQVKKKEVHQCPQLRVLVLIDNRRGFFTCDAHQIFLYQKKQKQTLFCVLDYLFSFALCSSQYFFVSLFNKDDTSIISK